MKIDQERHNQLKELMADRDRMVAVVKASVERYEFGRAIEVARLGVALNRKIKDLGGK